MELIDKNEVKKVINSYYQKLNELLDIPCSIIQSEVLQLICEIPTVDIVATIVQCKDCRYWAQGWHDYDAQELFMCEGFGANGFCSQGQK